MLLTDFLSSRNKNRLIINRIKGSARDEHDAILGIKFK